MTGRRRRPCSAIRRCRTRAKRFSLKVYDSAEEAAKAHRAGLLRLFMLQLREQVKYLDKNVPGLSQMGMQFMALGSARGFEAADRSTSPSSAPA